MVVGPALQSWENCIGGGMERIRNELSFTKSVSFKFRNSTNQKCIEVVKDIHRVRKIERDRERSRGKPEKLIFDSMSYRTSSPFFEVLRTPLR